MLPASSIRDTEKKGKFFLSLFRRNNKSTPLLIGKSRLLLNLGISPAQGRRNEKIDIQIIILVPINHFTITGMISIPDPTQHQKLV